MYDDDEKQTRPLLRMQPLSWARAISKQKVCLIAVWIAGMLAATMIVYKLPLVYKSGALILVEGQRIPKDFVSPTVDTALAEQLGALKEQVLSYSTLVRIIRKYNLYVSDRRSKAEEQIVDRIREDISIDIEKSGSQGQSNAFRVSYQGPNPSVVAAVARELSGLFVQENLRLRQNQADGTAEFLSSQLAEAKERLDEQEAKLSDYKLKHNGQLPEQESALLAKLNQLQLQLQGVDDRASRAQQSKILLDASLKSAQEYLISLIRMANRREDGSAAGQLSSTELLERQLAELERQYTSNHPDVIRARELLAAARARDQAAEEALKTQTNHSASQSNVLPESSEAIARERERITQLQAEEAVLTKQIAGYEQERQTIISAIGQTQASVDQLPVREQDMASILRDYQTSKTNYQSLLDKKLAAEMAGAMERRQKSERFVILEPARVPEVPFKPKRPALLGGGYFAALLLAAGVAALRERRRDMFLGEWELPPEVPILARVPQLNMPALEGTRTPAAT